MNPETIYGLPATGVETSRVENRSEPAGCFKAELTVTKELPGQQAVTVRNSIAIVRADEPGAAKKAVEWVGVVEEKIKAYDHCTISYVLQSLAANPSLNSHVATAYRAVAAEICNHAASLTSEMQAVIGTGDERGRCAAHLDGMAQRAESPAIKAAYVLAAKQLRELK